MSWSVLETAIESLGHLIHELGRKRCPVLGVPSAQVISSQFYRSVRIYREPFRSLRLHKNPMRQIMLIILFDGWEIKAWSHLPRVTQLESRSSESTLKDLSPAPHSLSGIELWSPASLQDPLIQELQTMTFFFLNSGDVAKVTEHIRGEAFLCSCCLTRVTITTGTANSEAEKALYPHYCLPAFRLWKDS